MKEKRWIALSALAYMLCLGMALPIYAGSVVNTFMVVDLGWSRQILGLLVAVNMIVNGLLAPVGAMIVTRFGVRLALLAGALLMALCSALLATVVNQPWQAILAFSIGLGVAANLTGIIACQTGIAHWFREDRTKALSILYAAMGVGGFASVWAVTQAIEWAHSWRAGWGVFTVAALIGVAVTVLLVRDHAEEGLAGGGPQPDLPFAPDAESPASAHGPATFAQALKAPFLWAVCGSMLAATAGAAFLTAHVQVYLRDIGVSPAMAASAVSVFSLATLGGNLAVGAVSSRLAPKAAYAASGALFALSLLILANVSGDVTLYAYALIAGFAFGASQVGAMAVLGHYWNTRLFPALTAMGLLIQTAGGGIVPILAGGYFDAHHSYLPVIMVLVTLNLVTALVLTLVRTPRGERRAEPALSV